MHPITAGDSYDTPADAPRYLADRLALGTRWGFFGHYLAAVFATRAVALRGALDDQAWIDASLRIVRDIEGCGGRFHLAGLDHLVATPGPAVIVSNHQGTMETMIFPGIINPRRRITFVVKESLLHGSLFGPVMRSREPIAVRRENPRDDFKTVMEEGPRVLAGGRSLMIFPQAHRRDQFDPADFNSLGVKVAVRAGVPVIPAVIQTDFWGNGRLIKEAGPIRRHRPIRMTFGAPLMPVGNGRDAHQAVLDFISAHLAEWARLDPPR